MAFIVVHQGRGACLGLKNGKLLWSFLDHCSHDRVPVFPTKENAIFSLKPEISSIKGYSFIEIGEDNEVEPVISLDDLRFKEFTQFIGHWHSRTSR